MFELKAALDNDLQERYGIRSTIKFTLSIHMFAF